MLNIRLAVTVLTMYSLAGVLAGADFDVASVKINKLQTGLSGISAKAPGRFVVTNTPLRFIVLYAYRLLDHELVGAPDRTRDTSIDITAEYPAALAPSDQEICGMVQRLLKERFGLEIHRDKRSLPSYDLTLVRKDNQLGPAMKPSTVDCQQWIADKRPQRDAGKPSAVSPTGHRPACMISAGRRFMTGGSITIQQLSAALQSMVSRPIVDRTGLQGEFDIDLKWALMDDSTNDTPQADSPSIFTAIREQLGLKLETRQEPFDVVVVDRITHPTAN